MFMMRDDITEILDGEMADKFPEAFLWRAKRLAELRKEMNKKHESAAAMMMGRAGGFHDDFTSDDSDGEDDEEDSSTPKKS